MTGLPRPSLAGLPHRARELARGLPERYRAWRDGFRQAGGFSWRGPIVRGIAVLLVAAGVIFTVNALIRLFTLSFAGSFGEAPSPTATLYVACTNSACLASYTTRQPLNFASWPLTCAKCGQPSVFRATLCTACRKWFSCHPAAAAECPHCAADREATARASQPAHRPSQNSDDAEDPW